MCEWKFGQTGRKDSSALPQNDRKFNVGASIARPHY